jgi:hypothetical protein
MARPFLLLLVVLGCVPGCARRAQPNSDRQWPQESAVSLDLSQSTQQQHFSADAEFAEDLAIRYADARRGPDYQRTRDQCMAGLFQVIADSHRVTQDQVRRSLEQRRTDLDLAIMLSYAVLYGWTASIIARRVLRLYPHEEERLARVVMTFFASGAVSAAGVLLGEQWAWEMETLRIGNGHMSYRADRIPWGHHRLGLFVGGVVLFWLVAAFHHRAAIRSPANP